MIHIRISKALLPFSFLLITFLSFSQENRLSLYVIGDIMQHDGQISAAYNSAAKKHDYKDGFRFIKPVIESYDIAIGNLEVTLAGKPYKGYPQFSAPDVLGDAIKDAGFDIILTANNHSCDRGSKGVKRTLDQLDSLKLPHLGTYRNKAERDSTYPLLVEKKGVKFALLNYTYGTNGLKVAKPLIINYIDSAVMAKDLAKAKTMDVDFIIVTTHWGKEYQPLPDNYQKKWEAFCYRHGADMVIGGHPHVVQPMEKKVIDGKERLTVWSLGNFVSNQRARTKDGGMAATVDLVKKEGKTSFENPGYYFNWVFPRKEGKLKPYYILPAFDYAKSDSTFLTKEEDKKMKLFLSDSRKLFAEHSKGVTEFKADSIQNVKEIYNLYLKGYYSVEIARSSSPDLPKNINPILSEYVHRVALKNGSYVFLSGIAASQKDANGARNFMKDCGFSDLNLVKVKANLVTPIQE